MSALQVNGRRDPAQSGVARPARWAAAKDLSHLRGGVPPANAGETSGTCGGTNVSARVHPQLGEHLRRVAARRVPPDVEFGGDLVVGLAVSEQGRDLALPDRQ